MRLNIVIGGAAGQGINKVSSIVTNVLKNHGYFTFNYRDYPSLIRGGHNFNTLSVCDKPISSHEASIDIVVALSKRAVEVHKGALKKKGVLIEAKDLRREGKNLNIAMAGALLKTLGVPLKELEEEVKRQFKESKEALVSAKKGYEREKSKFKIKKLDNSPTILSGSQAVAVGARNSGLDLYIAYPMTPSTNALHEMAKDQIKKNMMVFQAENEISVANMAIGASFAGAKTMIGTSGGGFDLMGETLSLQGITQIPLTVYLASRPGPGTGVPTYTSQADLNIALRAGHGEFPRIVVAPGNPTEVIEKTSEALFLAEKFKILSIILSDKHLAESEFSTEEKPRETIPYRVKRRLPGKSIVKASSYESNSLGNSTESYGLVEKNVDKRLEKYEELKEYINKNCEMVKIHGKENSKNLIVGWGSTSGAIIDAIKGLNAKFLQVLYLKPMSPKVKEEIKNAKNVILVECNTTGQLGRLIREKTGLRIDNRLLKYNGRPFHTEELHKYLKEMLE